MNIEGVKSSLVVEVLRFFQVINHLFLVAGTFFVVTRLSRVSDKRLDSDMCVVPIYAELIDSQRLLTGMTTTTNSSMEVPRVFH